MHTVNKLLKSRRKLEVPVLPPASYVRLFSINLSRVNSLGRLVLTASSILPSVTPRINLLDDKGTEYNAFWSILPPRVDHVASLTGQNSYSHLAT